MCYLGTIKTEFFKPHTVAAGDGEEGAGPVPVAGPDFGSSATFKLPVAAGLGSGVATQVVGKRSGSSGTEDDAVVVGKEKKPTVDELQ